MGFLVFIVTFVSYSVSSNISPWESTSKIELYINDSLDLSDLCRTLIFINTNFICEMKFQRKPLTAVSVLTLEINSGIDVWAPQKWWSLLLLTVHSLLLASPSEGRSWTQIFAQQCLSMRGIESCWVEDTWPSQFMTYESYCKSRTLYWFCRMWTRNWLSSHSTL